MPGTTFAVTTKRGPALAREILETIEAEEARVAALEEADYADAEYEVEVKDGNVWNQGSWGEVYLNRLPKDVDVEVITNPNSLKDVYSDGSSTVVSLSGGLSCGTAMCFAGHAVNMAGDRLVLQVDNTYAHPLKQGKKRKRVRTWLSRLHKSGQGFPYSENASKVITPEGKIMGTADRARDLLELSFDDADLLFSGSNTLADLRKYVKRMEENRHLSNGRKKS